MSIENAEINGGFVPGWAEDDLGVSHPSYARVAYRMLGEPLGEAASDEAIAEYIANRAVNTAGKLSAYQYALLRDIGEYLHCENPSEDERAWALNSYFSLVDSVKESVERVGG